LIVAGAGSGKTHTLTSRLKRLIERGVKPENIIAITFTNKASSEMRDRVFNIPHPASNPSHLTSHIQPFIGTFHSFGARILKQEAKLAGRTINFTIFDDDDSMSLLKKVMKAANISKERWSPPALHHKFSTVKSELISPEEIMDKTALKIFHDYEAALAGNNAFDFDDLIEKVVRLFEKHSEMLKKYQERFRYILVDEYQDVNTAQYRMVKLLAEKHKNLSVVGDDAQAIYGWRHADFRNFLNFDQDWPQAKIVKLEQNYRSSGNIITAASEVIRKNKLQRPKELWTQNPKGNPVVITSINEANDEAELIVSQLLSYAKAKVIESNPNNSSTAVLYRTNAQSRAIEQALIGANIPYKIFGGLKFYERKEIKDIVAALRVAANPRDTISAERIEKNFNKGVATHLLKELPRLASELSILELINFFLVNADYFEYLDRHYPNARERTENVKELIVFAGEFKELSEFLERVSLLQATDSPAKQLQHLTSRTQPVVLMTVHMAKGLEFDNVFVIGCNEGLLPHQMSYGSTSELEEERRLMYVAMTRAKNNLRLSFYGTPSRFLYEMPADLTDFVDKTTQQRRAMPDDDDAYIEYE